jgi:hypothetical protein
METASEGLGIGRLEFRHTAGTDTQKMSPGARLRRLSPRLRCMLRRRPAPGQLCLRFSDQPAAPQVRQSDRPSWRADRPALRPRRPQSKRWDSPGRREWQTSRWLRRGASCLLCGRWPAPHDHLVGGSLVLVCAECERRPDVEVRLAEVVREDWRRTPAGGRLVP